VSAGESPESSRVVEHQEGELLRLQTPGTYAMDMAIGLLGFLEAELEAEIEANGWRSKYGLKVAEPLAIKLEALDVELSTGGSEIELRRVGGSKDEFEDLCSLIVAEYLDG